MKQKKNSVVKKQDIRIPDKKDQFINLMMRFILTVIILVLLFIVNYFYNRKFNPVKLTKLQYHYYKEAEDSPEKDLIGNELSYAESLSQCPAGYCSINKDTGIKRCPDGNHQLVYNTIEETCTRKFFCDYLPLKYAVLTDGSTNSKGVCEEDVVCRCSKNKSCESSITGTFKLEYSSSNIDPDKNNFTILPTSSNQFGNISIQVENPELEFCELNPGFSDRVVLGCNFSNSINDKLGCDFISTLIEVERSGTTKTYVAAALSKNIEIGDTSFVSRLSDSPGFLESSDPNSFYPLAKGPKEGYLKISQGSTTEFVLYTNYTIDYEKNTLTVEGIIHLFTEKSNTPVESLSFPYGSTGFENSFNTSCEIESFFIDSLNCIVPSSGANYKNMLICTQKQNFCKNGIFSYNYDKLNIKGVDTNPELLTEENFSRNFCQQNIVVNNDIKINNNFLNDPSYYTMSCHLGKGCNDKFLNFGDLKGPEAAAGKYYPDFDIDGVNGVWDLLTTTFPIFTPEKPVNNSFLLNNETIEPGDYWAVKSTPEGLFTNLESKPGSCTIFVSSLLSLNQYINQEDINPEFAPYIKFTPKGDTTLGGTSFRVTRCDYGTSGFSIKVNVPSGTGFAEGVSSNIPVQVLPQDYQKPDSYGVILKSKKTDLGSKISNIFFGDYGSLTTDSKSTSVLINMEIFKQFSYNGGNYNTVVGYDSIIGRPRRYYSSNKGTPILYKDGNVVYPPQNQNNLFLQVREFAGLKSIGEKEYLNFQDRNADFKIPMSMYYPVWNPTLFKQECIKCKPFLLSYVNLTIDLTIDNVVIQYSARDFKNYEFNIKDKNFYYTSISKLQPDSNFIENTTRTLYLEEPNNNIIIGDYVMDSSLNLPFEIIFDSSGSGSFTEIKDNLVIHNRLVQTKIEDSSIFTFGKEESQNEDIIYGINNEIIKSNSNLSIKSLANNTYQAVKADSTKNFVGYFFGKKYQSNKITPIPGKPPNQSYSYFPDKSNGIYLIPIAKITNISQDKKIVTTDAPILSKLDQTDHYIQFCRLDKPLTLNLVENFKNNDNGIASGGEVVVDKISDGRITNINVKKSGKNYTQSLKPTITVSNYF